MCMYVYVLSKMEKGSQWLSVSHTCLSYEGRPGGLKASDTSVVSLHAYKLIRSNIP